MASGFFSSSFLANLCPLQSSIASASHPLPWLQSRSLSSMWWLLLPWLLCYHLLLQAACTGIVSDFIWFCFVASLRLVPKKLVDKVRLGQFIEMREFLIDNLVLQDRLEAIQGQNCHIIGSHPRLHEVVTLLSWACCFLAYVAIATSDPMTRDQLAYACLILGEAQAQGGSGWLHYDRAFQQLKVADPTLPWNTLEPGLHTKLVLGQHSGTPTFCSIYHESDHDAALCALAPVCDQQQLPQSCWSSSSFASIRGPGCAASRAAAGSVRRPESLEFICVSWNKGNCSFPGSCSCRHICATCHHWHMPKDCPSTPPTSEYKQPRSRHPLASASANASSLVNVTSSK